MDRIFYPSKKKYFKERYIRPAIEVSVSWLAIILLIVIPLSWILITMTTILTEGFRGDMLALELTSNSIYGPIRVGRDMPIPFNEIDFEKTRKKGNIYSFRGDEIKFEQIVFDPQDIAEIWEAILRFDKENG